MLSCLRKIWLRGAFSCSECYDCRESYCCHSEPRSFLSILESTIDCKGLMSRFPCLLVAQTCIFVCVFVHLTEEQRNNTRPQTPISHTQTPAMLWNPFSKYRYHDFNILFLFSFRFSRSTRFRCIVSASFSYLAFSSFAARFSFSAVILLCNIISLCPSVPIITQNLPVSPPPSRLSFPSPSPLLLPWLSVLLDASHM